jgi:hypothetical protein
MKILALSSFSSQDAPKWTNTCVGARKIPLSCGMKSCWSVMEMAQVAPEAPSVVLPKGKISTSPVARETSRESDNSSDGSC